MKKFLLLSILVILSFIVIGCSKNESEKTPTNTQNQGTAQKESKVNNLGEFKSFPTHSPKYLLYYLSEYFPDIYKEFSSERGKLDSFLKETSQEYQVKKEMDGHYSIVTQSKPRQAYSIQLKYRGEVKNNLPNGKGVLISDGINGKGQILSRVVYMGGFKDGYFSGYGQQYYVPKDNPTYLIFPSFGMMMDDLFGYFGDAKEAQEFFDKNYNYIDYEGTFEKGLRVGKGIRYLYPPVPHYDSSRGKSMNHDIVFLPRQNVP